MAWPRLLCIVSFFSDQVDPSYSNTYDHVLGRLDLKKDPFSKLLLHTPRPNLNVAVNAIGPETDFTLETDGKMCTKN